MHTASQSYYKGHCWNVVKVTMVYFVNIIEGYATSSRVPYVQIHQPMQTLCERYEPAVFSLFGLLVPLCVDRFA